MIADKYLQGQSGDVLCSIRHEVESMGQVTRSDSQPLQWVDCHRRFRTTELWLLLFCNSSFCNSDTSFFSSFNRITSEHEAPINYSKICLCF